MVSAAEMGSVEELLRVRKEIVNFHGEMVLLENYSALNYTGEQLLHKLYWRRAFWVFRGGQSRPPWPRGHGKSWLKRGGWPCPPWLTDLPRRVV